MRIRSRGLGGRTRAVRPREAAESGPGREKAQGARLETAAITLALSTTNQESR